MCPDTSGAGLGRRPEARGQPGTGRRWRGCHGKRGFIFPILFGVESVPTNDLRMKDRYVQGFPRIEARFARMIRQLKAPYQQATLPDVVSAEELWGHIAL